MIKVSPLSVQIQVADFGANEITLVSRQVKTRRSLFQDTLHRLP